MTTMLTPGSVPEWTIADRLRKSREFAGLTQNELAEDIGVSNRSISAYESGAAIKRPVLLSWAMRCGVDLVWLMGEWAPRGSNPQPTDYKVVTLHLRGHGLRRRHGRRRDSVRQLIPAA